MGESRSVSLYCSLRNNLRSAIYDSSFFSSNLSGRILFHLRLLEGRVLSYLNISTESISERKLEYSWVLKNFRSGGVILDVGCAGSFLCYELVARALETLGIDSRPFKKRPTKLDFFLADACYTPFKEEFFDTIIVISTMEHIGIGFYGDPIYDNGDALALTELTRILKREGKIFLTTPLVSKYAKYPGGKLYDLETLSKLISCAKLLVESKECYVPLKGKKWIKVKEDEAKAKKMLPNPERGHGVICLVLRKTKATGAREKLEA